ncbi:Alpha/Beta hydrolase protein [Bisporella sp. PMI_857]|nr:Alpha/Beta hydrolase protein [Bisporella sp. PMI_857]
MGSPSKVNFLSRGIRIAGDLYSPSLDAPDRNGAAIVVAHPWTSVKEQSSGLYAKLLAKHGFIALAYDAAYQGESEGEPRHLEDPGQRVEDVKAAVTFLTSTESVSDERIGVLGICASGGYVSNAAQTDVRIKSVATIVAVCTGVMAREGLPKGTSSLEVLKGQLNTAAEDRNGEAKGEQPTVVSMLPDKFEDAPANMPSAFLDLASYYRTPRGNHPRAPNVALPRSWDMMATYDAFRFNELISPRPLLMITGSKAESKNYSEDALKLAKEPKELFVIPDKTHADLYDDYHGVLPKLVLFFEGSLTK